MTTKRLGFMASILVGALTMAGCDGGHWPVRDRTGSEIEGKVYKTDDKGRVIISQAEVMELVKRGDAVYVGLNDDVSLVGKEVIYVDPNSLEGGEDTFVVRPGSLKTNIHLLAKQYGLTVTEWQGYDYYVERPEIVSGVTVSDKLAIILDRYPLTYSVDLDKKELCVKEVANEMATNVTEGSASQESGAEGK